MPEELTKYLGGYWPTWQEIPSDLRKWLIKIIVEETSIEGIPVWTIPAIMSAEQMVGGFRLDSRLSSASAIEPLGITPGWELSWFGTNKQRFDFRSQVRMVAQRIAANGLNAEALQKLGLKEYTNRFETYLCKHIGGEGRNCGPGTADRYMPAYPGNPHSVQDYINRGIAVINEIDAIHTDVNTAIKEEVIKQIDEMLGITLPAEAIRKDVEEVVPKVVNGEKPLSDATKEITEKQTQQYATTLKEEVEKAAGADPSSPSETMPLPAKEELLRIQAEAQKSLYRHVSPEEIADFLKANGMNPEKTIAAFQSVPEATLCQYAKVLLEGRNKKPTREEIRNIVDEALKIVAGQNPQTLNYAQIEAVKKRIEEILAEPLSQISLEKRFGGKDGIVAQNIKTALSKLPEGKITLPPGGVFDFNKTFGPYTPENNYLGGNGLLIAAGVCDLASLIYDGLTNHRNPNLAPQRTIIHGTEIPEIKRANTVSILTDAQGNSVHNLTVVNNTGRTITFYFKIENDNVLFYVKED